MPSIETSETFEIEKSLDGVIGTRTWFCRAEDVSALPIIVRTSKMSAGVTGMYDPVADYLTCVNVKLKGISTGENLPDGRMYQYYDVVAKYSTSKRVSGWYPKEDWSGGTQQLEIGSGGVWNSDGKPCDIKAGMNHQEGLYSFTRTITCSTSDIAGLKAIAGKINDDEWPASTPAMLEDIKYPAGTLLMTQPDIKKYRDAENNIFLYDITIKLHENSSGWNNFYRGDLGIWDHRDIPVYESADFDTPLDFLVY